MALGLAVCGSTASSSRGGSTGGAIPPSAFRDSTGITTSSVTIGNISTQTAGSSRVLRLARRLMRTMCNSQGGVHGRRLIVDSANDNFLGATKTSSTVAVQSDFALVGDFSLEDSFGGTVLAANPQMANISGYLTPGQNALPNSFSPNPAAGGYYLGPLCLFPGRSTPTRSPIPAH